MVQNIWLSSFILSYFFSFFFLCSKCKYRNGACVKTQTYCCSATFNHKIFYKNKKKFGLNTGTKQFLYIVNSLQKKKNEEECAYVRYAQIAVLYGFHFSLSLSLYLISIFSQSFACGLKIEPKYLTFFQLLDIKLTGIMLDFFLLYMVPEGKGDG